jgi:glycosyltransferase involved in cell wall biosynthesis
MSPSYSIIIPAFNEGRRLGYTLEQVTAFIAQQHWRAEIIVVNDGSTDNTMELIREFANRNTAIRVVNNPGNRGKGFSVRNGMLNAHGDVLLFTDADLSAPISEAPKLLAAIEAGADVAIGSRWLDPSLQTHRQSLLRQVLGRGYNLLMRLILGLNFKDTQCGFKAFRSNAARLIFRAQHIERWGFDPELLFLARRAGLKVKEVPIRWGHDRGTRIHPFSDGLQMFVEMLSIRWSDLRGDYNIPSGQAAKISSS